MMNKKFILYLIFFSVNTSYTILFAQDTLLKVRYVSIPFDLIDDEQINLTTSDFSFWKSKIKESRQVYFSSFDIDFTSNDSLQTYLELKNKSQNFANNFQDTVLFFQNGGQAISLNYEQSSPYFNKSVGSTISFIQDNELYVSKIIGKKPIADSVHVKYIMFKNENREKVEKVLNALKSKSISWEEANMLYNSDENMAKKGGDLGYITQGLTLESFDKLCFEIANIGEYYKLESEIGDFIVQVLDRKYSHNAYSLQTLSYVTPVILSSKTLEKAELKVQKLIGKSKNIDELERKLLKEGVFFERFRDLPYSINGALEWITTAKNGDISTKPIQFYDNFSNKCKLMVLGMRVLESQNMSDEDFEKEYGIYMRRKKKEDLICQYIKEINSIEGIALKYNVEIKEIVLPITAEITTTDEIISNTSFQNKLMGYKQNELSEPIIGYNGIYFAHIILKK